MSARRSIPSCGLVLLLVCAAGKTACSSGDPTANAGEHPTGGTSTAPSTAGTLQTYENRSAHFALKYPAEWAPRSEPRNVLSVGPPVANPAAEASTAELNVAVPALPFHIPGLIPLGEVERGYVDDLKKRHTDVRTLRSADISFDNAHARRFVVTGKPNNGGPERVYDVLVVYRKATDTLYVVGGEAPTADQQTAHAVVDTVVASWRWLK